MNALPLRWVFNLCFTFWQGPQNYALAPQLPENKCSFSLDRVPISYYFWIAITTLHITIQAISTIIAAVSFHKCHFLELLKVTLKVVDQC